MTIRRIAALILLLFACGRVSDEVAQTPAADAPGIPVSVEADSRGSLTDSAATATPPAATAATDTIQIEGTVEVIAVQPVQSREGFPLPFQTVAPADMGVEFVSSGEGDAARFVAEFGGVRSPDAFVSFTVLAEGDEAVARTTAADVAAELGGVPADDALPAWATQRYRIQGESLGSLVLGQHAGRWFYFLVQYPPEYGDGMGPRVDLIQRRWRWADGSTLRGE